MELTRQQVDYLNKLLDEANKNIKDVILLEGYKQSPMTQEEETKAEKALKLYQEVISHIPNHYASWMLMGKVYQRQTKYKDALACFDRSMTLTDDHLVAQEAALVAMAMDEYEKAEKYGEEALCRNPTSIAVLGNHAMNLMHMGKDKEAIIAIDRAIEIDPNDEINRNIKNLILNVINGKRPRPSFKELLVLIFVSYMFIDVCIINVK